MKIVTENGKTQYIMKKWLATHIAFFVCIAFCVFTAVFALVRFCLGQIDGGELFHDAGISIGAIALLFVPFLMERLFKWYLPNLIILSMYFIVVMNMVCGEVWHLFEAEIFSGVTFFDKIMHTFNGVIFMFLGYSLVGMLNNIPEKQKNLSPVFCALFALGFAMLIEYIWEIYEYTLDSISEMYNMQRWKDDLVSTLPNAEGYYESISRRGSAITDTIGDMVVHIIGAIPVGILGLYKMYKQGDLWLLRTSVLSKKQVIYLKQQNLSESQPEVAASENVEISAQSESDAVEPLSPPPENGGGTN